MNESIVPLPTRPGFKNLTGLKFGRLLIQSYKGISKNRKPLWDCLCDCGITKTILGPSLINGNTSSCGCLRSELVTASKTKHGMKGTKEYSIWCAMKGRCNNIKDPRFNDYGGRGIKVCDRWDYSFNNFYQDMGSIPGPNFSIDRIHNGSGYGPQNCKWSTHVEQARNQRNRKDNLTGVRGVAKLMNGRYLARIGHNKEDLYIGTFSNLCEAAEARIAKEKELGYSDGHGRSEI